MQNTIQHNEKTKLTIKYNAALQYFAFHCINFIMHYIIFITYPEFIGDIRRNTRSFVNYYWSFNCQKYLES